MTPDWAPLPPGVDRGMFDPGPFYARRRGRTRLARTLEGLTKKYSPDRARRPRIISGTFVAPLDLGDERYRRLRLEKVLAFVQAMDTQGWRLLVDRRHPVRVEAGATPAYDLQDGAPRPGFREYVVSAWFTFPDPKPVRIELPDYVTKTLPATEPERLERAHEKDRLTMPGANIQSKSIDFQPTAVGAGQTKALFSVAKGTRVWAASAEMLIPAAASTDSTMVLGDTAATNGYIAAIDTETTAAGTMIAGAGTHLAASGGKLYTAASTVDVVYAGTTFGATNPKVKFTIFVSRDYPGPGPIEMPATSVKTLQSAAVAIGNGTTFRGNDCVRVVMQITGITTATVTFEVSVNNSTWVGILAAPPSTGTGALTATADGAYAMAAWPYMRARISAWTSGSITIVAANMP